MNDVDTAHSAASTDATNVVLVHGATLDGSGWRGVYDILRARGLTVSVVQLPNSSFEADVAATIFALERREGPTVLVGHSYAGAVITEAGMADTVKALVYVAALQPDKDETVGELSQLYPTDITMVMLNETQFILDPATYHETVGSDLPRSVSDFLTASARPMSAQAFSAKLTRAAWREKPTFGILTTEDRVVSPRLLRWMYERSGSAITEIEASHMVYMSKPQEVADVILMAAESTG